MVRLTVNPMTFTLISPCDVCCGEHTRDRHIQHGDRTVCGRLRLLGGTDREVQWSRREARKPCSHQVPDSGSRAKSLRLREWRRFRDDDGRDAARQPGELWSPRPPSCPPALQLADCKHSSALSVWRWPDSRPLPHQSVGSAVDPLVLLGCSSTARTKQLRINSERS